MRITSREFELEKLVELEEFFVMVSSAFFHLFSPIEL